MPTSLTVTIFLPPYSSFCHTYLFIFFVVFCIGFDTLLPSKFILTSKCADYGYTNQDSSTHRCNHHIRSHHCNAPIVEHTSRSGKRKILQIYETNTAELNNYIS